MNQVLVEAMIAHPQLALVDWHGYAQGHRDWFQTDNLHLLPAGGAGIATLLHQAGLAEPLALAREATLPAAQRGQPYQARLGGAGAGGSWRIVSGASAAGATPRGKRRRIRPPAASRLLSSPELLLRSVRFQLAPSAVHDPRQQPHRRAQQHQPTAHTHLRRGVAMKAPNSKAQQAGRRTNLTSR